MVRSTIQTIATEVGTSANTAARLRVGPGTAITRPTIASVNAAAARRLCAVWLRLS